MCTQRYCQNLSYTKWVIRGFVAGVSVIAAASTWALTPTLVLHPPKTSTTLATSTAPAASLASSGKGTSSVVVGGTPTASSPVYSPGLVGASVESSPAKPPKTIAPASPTVPTAVSPVQPAVAVLPLSTELGALVKTLEVQAAEPYSSPDTANLPKYEPRQVVLSWAADQQGQVLVQLGASKGRLLKITPLSSLGLTVAVLEFDTQAQADLALSDFLSATPNITSAKLTRAYNMQAGAAGPALPALGARQYALGILKAINKSKLASPIVVGMVDTEIAAPDLLSTASIKTRRLFADTDKPASTEHGSAVAAILASKSTETGFHGLAQGVHLRAAGVMREVAPGVNATNTLMVVQAIDWLVSENAQVINLSLGSAYDAVMASVVSKAVSAGVVLVAAAGNGGSAAAPSYPAAYPGVIAVTAIDANKQLYTRANRGDYISIAAPGVDVWVPVGKGRYMSGTSFAAPFVAAAIAQKMAQSPKVKNVQTAPNLLKTLCSNALALSAQNPSPEFGCGLVQL